MTPLDERKVGEIVVYLNEFREEKLVAISKIYKEEPIAIFAVPYSANNPIKSNSRPFLLKVQEEQEKKGLAFLAKPGDWYCLGKVSNHEKEELEKIPLSQYPSSGMKK